MGISKEISKIYSFSDTLGIFAAVYSKNGAYIGDQAAESGILQLCRFPELHLRAAWLFAAPHERSCAVTYDFLKSQPETQFYELFLKFKNDAGEEISYPIITELSCDDTCQGSLTELSVMKNFRRLFTIDTVSTYDTATGVPGVVRFAKEVTLRVRGQQNRFAV